MDALLSPPPLLETLRQEFRQLLQAARQRCIDLYEARSGGSSSDAAAACDLMPIRHGEDHIIADLNALRVQIGSVARNLPLKECQEEIRRVSQAAESPPSSFEVAVSSDGEAAPSLETRLKNLEAKAKIIRNFYEALVRQLVESGSPCNPRLALEYDPNNNVSAQPSTSNGHAGPVVAFQPEVVLEAEGANNGAGVEVDQESDDDVEILEAEVPWAAHQQAFRALAAEAVECLKAAQELRGRREVTAFDRRQAIMTDNKVKKQERERGLRLVALKRELLRVAALLPVDIRRDLLEEVVEAGVDNRPLHELLNLGGPARPLGEVLDTLGVDRCKQFQVTSPFFFPKDFVEICPFPSNSCLST